MKQNNLNLLSTEPPIQKAQEERRNSADASGSNSWEVLSDTSSNDCGVIAISPRNSPLSSPVSSIKVNGLDKLPPFSLTKQQPIDSINNCHNDNTDTMITTNDNNHNDICNNDKVKKGNNGTKKQYYGTRMTLEEYYKFEDSVTIGFEEGYLEAFANVLLSGRVFSIFVM